MLAILLALGLSAQATSLPKGEVVEVTCAAAPTQSYALYVPTSYTSDHAWPVIYLFDAGGRGSDAVTRYRAAAEVYGYILAGSNNSRNGRPNAEALVALPADVTMRFHVDPRRVYTGGMSGGSRVALGMALEGKVAGVFAHSASYPDAAPRKSVPFAVFATTGTEDFNHLELRQLDRALTTPAHRLTVFEGGHQYPPDGLILEGVEWMDIQAMKSKLKPRDEKEIEQIFAKRLAAAGDRYESLRDLATDFEGLRDVSALTRKVTALGREASVQAALRRERDLDDRENTIAIEIKADEAMLEFPRQRDAAMMTLRKAWTPIATAANAPQDSSERQMARRVAQWLTVNTLTSDQDYRDMVREMRATVGTR